MKKEPTLVLRNASASVCFAPVAGGYRPEWFRLGRRPMLRFKDHEFLNVGAVRVTVGRLTERRAAALSFAGTVDFAGVPVEWSVRVSLPADGGGGFTVDTVLTPTCEPIEVLEALTCFETPYEYAGDEHQTTLMSQQPVYRSEGSQEVTGAGYVHPFWYYGRPGRAHLTYMSSAPVMCSRVADPDGGNARCTTLLGNWHVCSIRDMFAQPTRNLGEAPDEIPFPDRRLSVAPGRRGRKFLIGAANWNTSLHKDPNLLVEVGAGLRQQVTVDFAGELPGGRWDTWLAAAWERSARLHFPADGRVPAWEVARSRGASWVEAAQWLTDQLRKPEGCPGFFNPEKGPVVYAPHTRPKWDGGVAEFAGQWIGPTAFLGHVWADSGMVAATERLEALFARDRNNPEHIWTIGPTPFHVAAMRKARLMGVSRAVAEKVEDFVVRRGQFHLDPPAGGRRGDGGILAWDAFANLLAAELFDRRHHTRVAKELLARVEERLDKRFESFNCAAEGDLVGANQGRPFGHGIALSANVLAWKRFGDSRYLDLAERFANLMMGLYYATANVSQSPDLDIRGWAVGANGGRDQYCNLPPWETGHALQQLAYIIEAGRPRDGFYDLLWLFAHTGLCQFPKARTSKRLYTPDFGVTYRPIDAVASERAFYLALPYLAYEEPWDQTMLAGYQGVEPILLSLYLGGGLIAAEDDRVLALVPRAPLYDADLAKQVTVHLWNPLDRPVETRLRATIAERRRETWVCRRPAPATLDPESPFTPPLQVPPRQVLNVDFARR